MPAPSPVSVDRKSSHAPPVLKIFEDLQSFLYDPVRFLTLQVYDETHAAGVMLEARIVETLRTHVKRLARSQYQVNRIYQLVI